MAREKHGEYDRSRGLPNNTGKPQGSGIFVWLLEEVKRDYPDLGAKHASNPDRYRAILKELQATNEPAAQSICSNYLERRRADSRERNKQKQLWMADHYEERAKLEPSRSDYLIKQAAKIRKRYE